LNDLAFLDYDRSYDRNAVIVLATDRMVLKGPEPIRAKVREPTRLLEQEVDEQRQKRGLL